MVRFLRSVTVSCWVAIPTLSKQVNFPVKTISKCWICSTIDKIIYFTRAVNNWWSIINHNQRKRTNDIIITAEIKNLIIPKWTRWGTTVFRLNFILKSLSVFQILYYNNNKIRREKEERKLILDWNFFMASFWVISFLKIAIYQL